MEFESFARRNSRDNSSEVELADMFEDGARRVFRHDEAVRSAKMGGECGVETNAGHGLDFSAKKG